MAKAVSQAAVLNELKKRAAGAWADSRNVAPKPKGITRLPGGINRGIGRIFDAVLKMSDDKGKGSSPQVNLRFVVREPKSFDGVQQTKVYSFFDSSAKKGKSVSEKLDEFSSDIQLLGVPTEGTDFDDFPRLLEELKANRPYFYYNTWEPPAEAGQEQRTMIFIQGLATDYTPQDDEPQVVPEADGEAADEPAPEPQPEPEPELPKAPPKAPPKAAAKTPPKAPPKAAPAPQPEPEPEPEPEAEAAPKATPEPKDRYACVLQGNDTTVEIVDVNTETQTCTVIDESTGKRWGKVHWSLLK